MGQKKISNLHIVTDIKDLKPRYNSNSIMSYVAAYLLASLGGNESPSTDDIKTILESVGVGYDEDSAETVVSKCAGKSISELIAEGSAKMASMPAGGGGGGGSSGGAAAVGDDAPAVEEKKEEKKESSDESGSDDDM